MCRRLRSWLTRWKLREGEGDPANYDTSINARRTLLRVGRCFHYGRLIFRCFN